MKNKFYQKQLSVMISIVLASLAGAASANEVITVPVDLVCVNSGQIDNILDEFGEIPFVHMKSQRQQGSRPVVSNSLIIFANPKTKTYTMVEQYAPEIFCIVATGEGLAPH